jgi:hypothetical protein
MSPVALLYILLASPIFSENLYSRRHFNELPISHYSKNFDLERLFHESPLDTILSTSTPSWIRRSNVFGRRSIVSEIFPEESIFGEESTFSPLSMRHTSLRNIEVIRRLAVEHPEMLNVVIEKLIKNFRPESLLSVEPESLIFGEKLIRKLPVYLREKIVRRLIKKSVSPSWISTRRSLIDEVIPTFESPIMTKVLSEKLIRRSVEKKIVKRVLRMIKKTVRSPYHVEEMLHTVSPVSMYHKSSTKRIVKKIVKRIVKKLVKKALRHNKRFGGYTPMPWSKNFNKFCMNFCSSTCMYNWTPMCNVCEMCPNWTPMTPSSYTPSTYNTKIVKKLIKKLSAEELLF